MRGNFQGQRPTSPRGRGNVYSIRDLKTKVTNDRFREEREGQHSATTNAMEITNRKPTNDQFREEREGLRVFLEKCT